MSLSSSRRTNRVEASPSASLKFPSLSAPLQPYTHTAHTSLPLHQKVPALPLPKWTASHSPILLPKSKSRPLQCWVQTTPTASGLGKPQQLQRLACLQEPSCDMGDGGVRRTNNTFTPQTLHNPSHLTRIFCC